MRYRHGDIVWARLGNLWWPGEVYHKSYLPPSIVYTRPDPVAYVKFFQANTLEHVKKIENMEPYQCGRKRDFIAKGMHLFHQKAENLDKFPIDVALAENRTRGDPNIIFREEFDVKHIDITITRKPHVAKVLKMATPKHLRPNVNAAGPAAFNCHVCSFKTNRLNLIVLHNKTHLKGAKKPSTDADATKGDSAPSTSKDNTSPSTSKDDTSPSTSASTTSPKKAPVVTRPLPARMRRPKLTHIERDYPAIIAFNFDRSTPIVKIGEAPKSLRVSPKSRRVSPQPSTSRQRSSPIAHSSNNPPPPPRARVSPAARKSRSSPIAHSSNNPPRVRVSPATRKSRSSPIAHSSKNPPPAKPSPVSQMSRSSPIAHLRRRPPTPANPSFALRKPPRSSPIARLRRRPQTPAFALIKSRSLAIAHSSKQPAPSPAKASPAPQKRPSTTSQTPPPRKAAAPRYPVQAEQTPPKNTLKQAILADWADDDEDDCDMVSPNPPVALASPPRPSCSSSDASPPKYRNIPKKDRREVIIANFLPTPKEIRVNVVSETEVSRRRQDAIDQQPTSTVDETVNVISDDDVQEVITGEAESVIEILSSSASNVTPSIEESRDTKNTSSGSDTAITVQTTTTPTDATKSTTSESDDTTPPTNCDESTDSEHSKPYKKRCLRRTSQSNLVAAALGESSRLAMEEAANTRSRTRTRPTAVVNSPQPRVDAPRRRTRGAASQVVTESSPSDAEPTDVPRDDLPAHFEIPSPIVMAKPKRSLRSRKEEVIESKSSSDESPIIPSAVIDTSIVSAPEEIDTPALTDVNDISLPDIVSSTSQHGDSSLVDEFEPNEKINNECDDVANEEKSSRPSRIRKNPPAVKLATVFDAEMQPLETESPTSSKRANRSKRDAPEEVIATPEIGRSHKEDEIPAPVNVVDTKNNRLRNKAQPETPPTVSIELKSAITIPLVIEAEDVRASQLNDSKILKGSRSRNRKPQLESASFVSVSEINEDTTALPTTDKITPKGSRLRNQQPHLESSDEHTTTVLDNETTLPTTEVLVTRRVRALHNTPKERASPKSSSPAPGSEDKSPAGSRRGRSLKEISLTVDTSNDMPEHIDSPSESSSSPLHRRGRSQKAVEPILSPMVLQPAEPEVASPVPLLALADTLEETSGVQTEDSQDEHRVIPKTCEKSTRRSGRHHASSFAPDQQPPRIESEPDQPQSIVDQNDSLSIVDNAMPQLTLPKIYPCEVVLEKMIPPTIEKQVEEITAVIKSEVMFRRQSGAVAADEVTTQSCEVVEKVQNKKTGSVTDDPDVELKPEFPNAAKRRGRLNTLNVETVAFKLLQKRKTRKQHDDTDISGPSEAKNDLSPIAENATDSTELDAKTPCKEKGAVKRPSPDHEQHKEATPVSNSKKRKTRHYRADEDVSEKALITDICVDTFGDEVNVLKNPVSIAEIKEQGSINQLKHDTEHDSSEKSKLKRKNRKNRKTVKQDLIADLIVTTADNLELESTETASALNQPSHVVEHSELVAEINTKLDVRQESNDPAREPIEERTSHSLPLLQVLDSKIIAIPSEYKDSAPKQTHDNTSNNVFAHQLSESETINISVEAEISAIASKQDITQAECLTMLPPKNDESEIPTESTLKSEETSFESPPEIVDDFILTAIPIESADPISDRTQNYALPVDVDESDAHDIATQNPTPKESYVAADSKENRTASKPLSHPVVDGSSTAIANTVENHVPLALPVPEINSPVIEDVDIKTDMDSNDSTMVQIDEADTVIDDDAQDAEYSNARETEEPKCLTRNNETATVIPMPFVECIQMPEMKQEPIEESAEINTQINVPLESILLPEEKELPKENEVPIAIEQPNENPEKLDLSSKIYHLEEPQSIRDKERSTSKRSRKEKTPVKRLPAAQPVIDPIPARDGSQDIVVVASASPDDVCLRTMDELNATNQSGVATDTKSNSFTDTCKELDCFDFTEEDEPVTKPKALLQRNHKRRSLPSFNDSKPAMETDARDLPSTQNTTPEKQTTNESTAATNDSPSSQTTTIEKQPTPTKDEERSLHPKERNKRIFKSRNVTATADGTGSDSGPMEIRIRMSVDSKSTWVENKSTEPKCESDEKESKQESLQVCLEKALKKDEKRLRKIKSREADQKIMCDGFELDQKELAITDEEIKIAEALITFPLLTQHTDDVKVPKKTVPKPFATPARNVVRPAAVAETAAAARKRTFDEALLSAGIPLDRHFKESKATQKLKATTKTPEKSHNKALEKVVMASKSRDKSPSQAAESLPTASRPQPVQCAAALLPHVEKVPVNKIREKLLAECQQSHNSAVPNVRKIKQTTPASSRTRISINAPAESMQMPSKPSPLESSSTQTRKAPNTLDQPAPSFKHTVEPPPLRITNEILLRRMSCAHDFSHASTSSDKMANVPDSFITLGGAVVKRISPNPNQDNESRPVDQTHLSEKQPFLQKPPSLQILHKSSAISVANVLASNLLTAEEPPQKDTYVLPSNTSILQVKRARGSRLSLDQTIANMSSTMATIRRSDMSGTLSQSTPVVKTVINKKRRKSTRPSQIISPSHSLPITSIHNNVQNIPGGISQELPPNYAPIHQPQTNQRSSPGSNRKRKLQDVSEPSLHHAVNAQDRHHCSISNNGQASHQLQAPVPSDQCPPTAEPAPVAAASASTTDHPATVEQTTGGAETMMELMAVPGDQFGGPLNSYFLCRMMTNGTYVPIDEQPLYLNSANQLVPMTDGEMPTAIRNAVQSIHDMENANQQQQLIDEYAMENEIIVSATQSDSSLGQLQETFNANTTFLLNTADGQQIVLDQQGILDLAASGQSPEFITADGQQIILQNTPQEILSAIGLNEDVVNSLMAGQQCMIAAEDMVQSNDILAAALADTEGYQQDQYNINEVYAQQVANGLDSGLVYPNQQGAQASTTETNAILTQPPIMSTLEQPSKATDCLTPNLELLGQSNIEQSLATIGVTNVPTSLELPITITNPAIAPPPSSTNPLSIYACSSLNNNGMPIVGHTTSSQSLSASTASADDTELSGYDLFTTVSATQQLSNGAAVAASGGHQYFVVDESQEAAALAADMDSNSDIVPVTPESVTYASPTSPFGQNDFSCDSDSDSSSEIPLQPTLVLHHPHPSSAILPGDFDALRNHTHYGQHINNSHHNNNNSHHQHNHNAHRYQHHIYNHPHTGERLLVVTEPLQQQQQQQHYVPIANGDVLVDEDLQFMDDAEVFVEDLETVDDGQVVDVFHLPDDDVAIDHGSAVHYVNR